MNGIDTQVAKAIDRLIERLRNARAYRKANEAAQSPPPEKNGDTQ